ncbi:MAG: PEFG-CTERM sorting domain-containing protein [Candidatus Nitrosopumilus sp. Bin_571-38]|jgi:hypothetical protein
MNKIASGILSIIILGSLPLAFAESDTDAKLEFAGTLEETLGHFWALEMNLDENNSELALVHATHPISELYETMSEHLEANPEFNEKLGKTLLELKDNANTEVTRNDAQSAIEDAKEIIQEARDIVIGDELSKDSAFKAQLINQLLETSKVEYTEAIENGEIIEMAEFQDGSAFIWRSQQIFEEIRTDVENSGKVYDNYVQIWEAYEQRHTPTQVTILVDELISEFEITSGVESEKSSHMEEVFGTETNTSLELKETIQMSSEILDENNVSSLSPLKQIKEGVEPENIQCNESLELIFKSSGNPACVKETSIQKLVSRGWTQ